ncbi:MAG: allantoicase [Verrucomicrobia bacterium]|nr:allantoicase [Verrucomicrobiota bacterium]
MTPIALDAPDFTRRYLNLADPRLGAEALSASDDFFAPKERLLNPEPAIFIPGKYDEHGKWMDGWETRRKRVTGHDWCIVRLGRTGVIKGVDLDTSHFTGNYPVAASIEACHSPDLQVSDVTEWNEILPASNLKGDSHHYLSISRGQAYTHVRLNIYPDGGLARLRVYGQPLRDWNACDRGVLYDLAAMENGGYVVTANNQHFGAAANMLMPGRGVHMGDGWETRRRREPGNDWCIIALGHLGIIQKVEVDTAHFKGNYPDRCSLQAAQVLGGTDDSLIPQSMFWPTLLAEQKLEMDRQHFFAGELVELGLVSHVRFNIIPDGGISRLRLWSGLG